eukprot:g22903.t1
MGQAQGPCCKAGETVMSAVTIPYPEDFGDVDAKDARQMSLKEYVQNVMGKVNSTSGTPLYVFSVVEQDDPKCFQLSSRRSSDAHVFLQLRHYHTHAYAALFSGKKQWLFYPPPKSSLSRQHVQPGMFDGRAFCTSGDLWQAIKAMNEDKRRRKQLPAVEGLQEGLKLKSSFPLACEQAVAYPDVLSHDVSYLILTQMPESRLKILDNMPCAIDVCRIQQERENIEVSYLILTQMPESRLKILDNMPCAIDVCRIQQERENIEVRLREMRARMAEERKTRLEQIQAIFAGLGAGAQSVLEAEKNC